MKLNTKVIMVLYFIWVCGVSFALSVVIAVKTRQHHEDTGRAQAVACHPGTYLENLHGGYVLCIGGRGEVWRAQP